MLVVGGKVNEPSSSQSTTELFDGGQWVDAGEAGRRALHTATLLGDGSVLVVGGFDDDTEPLGAPMLYVPGSGWRAISHPLNGSVQRIYHTATLLRTGEVLVAGGSLLQGLTTDKSAVRGTSSGWISVAHSMLSDRSFHTATLLANGKVLLTGGLFENPDYKPGPPAPIGEHYLPQKATEIFDPATDDWTWAGDIPKRAGATATLLETKCGANCGKVVVVGGGHKEPAHNEEDDLVAATSVFTPAPELSDSYPPSPIQGSVGQQHVITVTGTGLASVQKVTFGATTLCGPGGSACFDAATTTDGSLQVTLPDHAPGPVTGDLTVETEGGTASKPFTFTYLGGSDGGPGPTVPQPGDSGNTNVSGTSVRGESSPPPASPTGTGGGSPGTLNSPGSVNAPASDGGTLAAGGSNTSSGGAISNAPGAAGSAGPPSPLVVSQSASAAGTTHAPAAATQVAGAGQAVGNAAVGPLAEEGSEAATRYTMDRSEPSGIPAVAFAGAALLGLFTCALLVAGDPAKAAAAGAGGRGAY